jgi:hypothetical protein
MDSIYIINKRTKQILLFKEFKADTDCKIQLFIDNYQNIINLEKSPYANFQNNIFVYLPNNDNDDEILYLAIISQDVKFTEIDFSQFILQNPRNYKKCNQYSIQ